MPDSSAFPSTDTPTPVAAGTTIRRRRRLLALGVLALLGAAGGGWYFWQQQPAEPAAGTPGGPPRLTPIVVEAAGTEDFPVRLSAIGTVIPRTVVTVRSRVDGTLNRVNFEEGQRVRAGDLLAEIDPRPYEVALTQVQGQMGKDEALLANARADLSRYEGLAKLDAIPSQQLDTQRALVRQYEAAVKMDQGALDNARLQLSYTRITAPADGRAGLRQVDPGNLVRASDANGIVVITQVQPVTVVFPIPEADLGKLLARLGMQTPREAGRSRQHAGAENGGRTPGTHGQPSDGGGVAGRVQRPSGEMPAESGKPRVAQGERPTAGGAGQQDHVVAGAGRGEGIGTYRGASERRIGAASGGMQNGDRGGRPRNAAGGLAVEAWDRDGKVLLATGELLTVDNQLDVTTGTVKVKAIFPNQDGALFPNQFVNVRLVVNELKDAVVIPSAAVQRGARGAFVWLLKEDRTVTMRQLEVGSADGDRIPVLAGLQSGDQVAVDGFDRLREGGKVDVVSRESRAVKEGPGKRGGRRNGPGRGEGAPAGASGAPATPSSAAPAAPGAAPAQAGARPQP
ncbi:MAG: efflux RND transporter periplasmic adaptor subunit [Bacteroidota bacterium]